jgi:hypothetical protein
LGTYCKELCSVGREICLLQKLLDNVLGAKGDECADRVANVLRVQHLLHFLKV